MSYKFCKSGADRGNVLVTNKILRLSDGAVIPVNQNNKDYQEYLAWVAEGNTAESEQ